LGVSPLDAKLYDDGSTTLGDTITPRALGLKNDCDDGRFAPGGFFFGLINVAAMWWGCEGAHLGSLGQ